MADDASQQFEIDLPPELIGGAYADFANVWHTPTVFVMDFLTLAQPPREQVDAETASRRTRCSSWRRPSPSSWNSGSARRDAAIRRIRRWGTD
jgi:hypothetical protein